MGDAISRQAAINVINRHWYTGTNLCEADATRREIIMLPSADAVEVVRCKDCKHWHREIRNGIEYFNFNYCDLNHYGDGHNFYCADAERREP